MPDIGFIIYEVTESEPGEPTVERDITADPVEGLGPLGVQFKDVEAE